MLNSRTSLTSDVNKPRNGTRGWNSEDRTPRTELRERKSGIGTIVLLQILPFNILYLKRFPETAQY